MPDAATTAWVAAVVTNGGTVSGGRQTQVDNLIVGLKADGVWAKLDNLWLYAAENQPSALTSLTSGNLLSTVMGSPPFTVDQGYTGISGGSNNIATGFDAGVGTPLYTVNDAHYSVWCMTDIAPPSGGQILNAGGGGVTGLYLTFSGDGNVYARIQDLSASGSLGPPSSRIGHWLVNRTSSSLSAAYQNGVLYGSPNAAVGALPATFFVLSDNPNQASAASIGASLTTGQITSFYNRLATYLSFPASPVTVFDAVGRTIFKLRPRGWAW